MVHRNAEPSFTHQPSHGDCSPPLRLNQHCLLNSTPFPRVWSCLGRETLWGGLIPCRVFRQCLWGKRGSPCLGSIPGGGCTQMWAQRPCSAPSGPNPSPATQHHPKLMTACLQMEICWLQACSTSQGWFHSKPQSCWFHNLKWNSHFPRVLISLPRLFWRAAVIKCSQQCCSWALGIACGAGDFQSCRSHLPWGPGPQIWTCSQFTNLSITVLLLFFFSP